MMDKIELIDQVVIQHGPRNNRVYIMSLPDECQQSTINKIESIAAAHGYTKIFAKVPEKHLHLFALNHYRIEAEIPNLFSGNERGYMLGRYFDDNRKTTNPVAMEQFLAVLNSSHNRRKQKPKASTWNAEVLTRDDAEELAFVYQTVFQTYPFPIFNPQYLSESMDDNVVYFGIRIAGVLSAVSSAEMDEDYLFAELTDFATIEPARGKGLASVLLSQMEEEMKNRGMKTVFTIARLESLAMNKTFLNQEYTYAGTLANNTQISGGIESMNVLYKSLL